MNEHDATAGPALSAAAGGGGGWRGIGNVPATQVLIGRVAELQRIRELLASVRLVTLTGVGGVGKTRTAVAAVARELPRDFRDGVWVVSLAAASETDDVTSVVATELELQLNAERATAKNIAGALAEQQRLIVLDNCEHVIEAATSLVDTVLVRCPEVVVLATSREPLGCENEHVLQLQPLGVDARNGLSDAAEMFCDRLRRLIDGVTLDVHDEQIIEAIVRRLEGLPLALELAAARVPAFGLRGLQERLDHTFDLLQRNRGPVPRHHSVRAAVAWSYELLDDQEQRVFEHASVFSGGFDLDAATAVCGGRDVAVDVASLADKSLLSVVTTATGARYRQLEPVREFAERQLEARGSHEVLRSRHMRYFVDWSARAAAGIRGQDELKWHLGYVAEWANLRQAVKHALAVEDGHAACQLVCNVSLWAQERLQLELGEWAEAVFQAPFTRTDPLSVMVGAAACVVARIIGDVPRAERLFQTAQERQQSLGGQPEPWIVHASPYQVLFGEEVEAAHVLQALRSQAGDDPYWDATADVFELIPVIATLATTDTAHTAVGETRRLLSRFEELDHKAERIGNPTLIARAQAWHGAALRALDRDRALALLHDALASALPLGDQRLVYQIDMDLGPLYAALGRPIDALGLLTPRAEQFLRAGALQLAWSDCVAAIPALLMLGEPAVACTAIGHLDPTGPANWKTYLIGPDTERLAREAAGSTSEELITTGATMTDSAIIQHVLAAMRRHRDVGAQSRTRVVAGTFMFTDICASTPLLITIGDEAWANLIGWHDRMLRQCFENFHGEEINHTGDGFFVSFAAAESALQCAMAVQRTLDEHRREHGFAPHVRIGLHATHALGQAGQYVGRGVHEAARIGALAASDEIVASLATLQATTATATAVRDATLKGVDAPITIANVQWR